EVYLRDQYTGAHKSLPLGTLVKVTRLDNGMSVIVRINDRGPYCNECVIDVSASAAQAIDLLRVGRTRVSLEVVGHSDRNPIPNTSTTQAQPQSYDAPRTDLTVRGAAPAQQQVSRDQQVNIIANEVKGYAIQLGSFGEFSNAERRVISLQQQGFDHIFIYQQVREGKTYHKVVIAPFVTASDAQRRLEELRVNYQLDGMVIRLAW
ncbi:MAG: septal ring lytic transglycosylase RlpA family protein, partial [Lewinella sp.]|nr:septal ring lytic transglycosylase RlpA family protein [Lewinella sp.]